MIEPIFTDDFVGLADIFNTIEKANKRVANNARRQYYRTTNNWSNKPKFEIRFGLKGPDSVLDFEVFTESEIYKWVDEGTRKHQIFPKRYDFLTVRGYGASLYYDDPPAYFPKTSPNVFNSSGLGVYNEPDHYEVEFVTQWIEPRNWTEKLAETERVRFHKALNKEIADFVKKWGSK